MENRYKVLYGYNDKYIDVTSIFVTNYIVDGMIKIKQGTQFNTIFGDPYMNKSKKLIIYKDDFVTPLYVLGEHDCSYKSIELNLTNAYNNHKKICILFYGISHCLKWTTESIKKNIFDILDRHNIEYDIYMHANILDHEKLNENDYLYLSKKPTKIYLEKQSDIDKTLEHDRFLALENSIRLISPSTGRNILRAMYSLKKSYELVDKTYDYSAYLILRPDLYYYEPLAVHNIPCKTNTLYSANWGHYSGINDKCYMVSPDIVQFICNRYDSVFEGAEENCYTETFLKYICDINKINIDYTLGLNALRIRYTGKVENEPCFHGYYWFAQILEKTRTFLSSNTNL